MTRPITWPDLLALCQAFVPATGGMADRAGVAESMARTIWMSSQSSRDRDVAAMRDALTRSAMRRAA